VSGWPWPLDGVQYWFEDLWNWINSAAVGAVSVVSGWVWGAIRWLRDRVYEFVLTLDRWFHGIANELWGWILGAFEGLKSFVNSIASWITNQVHNFVLTLNSWIHGVANELWGWVSGAFSALTQAVSSFVSNSTNFLSGVLNRAATAISTGVTGLYTFMSNNIGMAINIIGDNVNNAVSGFGSWISGALAGVASALGEGLQHFWVFMTGEIPKAMGTIGSFITDRVVSPIVSGLGWVFTKLTDIVKSLIHQIEGLFRLHSPITPQDAFNLAIPMVVLALGAGALATGVIDAASTHILGSGLNLRSLGAFMKDLVNPSMFMGAILGVLVGVGIRSPVTQYYRRMFRPEIPDVSTATRMLWRGDLTEAEFRDVVGRWGYGDPFEAAYLTLTEEVPGPGDLIRFVVREVIKPEVFTEFMGKQGFAPLISEWFWEAHWMLPGRGEIVDAFHRGILTKEERDAYMVLHDFKPEPRPGIKVSDLAIVAGIAKTLIPRVDLRYGWEMGDISDEDLEDRYRWLGYEDDAPLMADIQRSRALVEEVHKVRDQWISDFLEGYIREETLRANLIEIGIGAVRVDYYVQYARMRRAREAKKDWLDYYEDGYVKDLVTDEEVEARAKEILVDPEALDLFLRSAYIRKYRKPKEIEVA